ncbi:YcgL domain-containing protein [Lysobacter niastensis]|uniref:YcgL domain-containing protein IU514_03295 n=1 Tax=Lysobacter niastensis TaxID=380629 RepID=A0ABS0B3J3_9GAMM|nr:YcgL domain-containing protein [Lysobacter niastensis]MBF6023046.1 YcgL domain-containing protein [Lysobacter niastensis]
MQAYVYKSLRKADTYVYLASRDDFTRLPEPLRSQLGALQFVLEVALTAERKLAREDAEVVRENLSARGFHLQFPPTVEDPLKEDWGTDA